MSIVTYVKETDQFVDTYMYMYDIEGITLEKIGVRREYKHCDGTFFVEFDGWTSEKDIERGLEKETKFWEKSIRKEKRRKEKEKKKRMKEITERNKLSNKQ